MRGGRGDDDRPRRAGDHDADQRAGDRARARRSPTPRSSPGSASSARRSTSSSGARSRRATRSSARARRSGRARFPANGDGTYTTAPVDADRGRLLHLPRVDRRDARPIDAVHDGVRRGRGDDDRQGRAEGDDGRLRRRRQARRADLRHAEASPGWARRRRPSRSTLYGPYASRADIDCAGTPYWKGDGRGHRRRHVHVAEGDGPARRLLRLPRADRRHRDRRRPRGASAQVEAETSLGARRSILGGRGDDVAYVRARAGRRPVAGQARAARDRRAGLAVGIDMKAGALGIPTTSSASAGGATARRPATTRARSCSRGHVDSAKDGRGRVLRAQERPPRRHRHRDRRRRPAATA